MINFINSLPAISSEYHVKTGLPFVTLSYAQSLDGSIAAKRGEALGLSGPESLRLTHRLRSVHDAILVGIGTVLSDNPRLTVRLVNGQNPRPIVVDSQLRIPLNCKLFNENSVTPWVIATEKHPAGRREAVEASGASVLTFRSDNKGQVDLRLMLRRLGEMGIASLMVEGGARIITSFLFGGLANYLVLTIAPVLVGGLRGVNDLGPKELPEPHSLNQLGHKWLGKDLILWGNLI
jgi:riboflavin-specific deaminase-like protein